MSRLTRWIRLCRFPCSELLSCNLTYVGKENQGLETNITARALSQGLVSRTGCEADVRDVREDPEHRQGHTFRKDCRGSDVATKTRQRGIQCGKEMATGLLLDTGHCFLMVTRRHTRETRLLYDFRCTLPSPSNCHTLTSILSMFSFLPIITHRSLMQF